MSSEIDHEDEPEVLARRLLLRGASPDDVVATLVADEAWMLDEAATRALVKKADAEIERTGPVSRQRLIALYLDIHRRAGEIGDSRSLSVAKSSLDAVRELQQMDD